MGLPRQLLSLLFLSLSTLPAWSMPKDAIPVDCQSTPAQMEKWIARHKNLERLYSTNVPLFRIEYLAFVTRYPNMGVDTFSFHGKPKMVYRSAILSENPKCLTSLVKQHGLRNIVYLYSGDYVNEEQIPYKEENLLNQLGGNAYIRVLNFGTNFKTDAERKKIEERVTNIIHLISQLEGTTLIHCIEGMHRTGIVYAILEKCVKKTPIDEVIHNYKVHTNSVDRKVKYAYKKSNVDFIKKYNCKNLNLPSN